MNVYMSASLTPSFFTQVEKISFQECMFLLLVFLMRPLYIGFGFSNQGLAAFFVALTTVSYVLGVVLCEGQFKRRCEIHCGTNQPGK